MCKATLSENLNDESDSFSAVIDSLDKQQWDDSGTEMSDYMLLDPEPRVWKWKID